MKLTVKRSQWLRGEGNLESFLLRPTDGKMCCLGFLSLSCGFSPADIFWQDSPAKVDVILPAISADSTNAVFPYGIIEGYYTDADGEKTRYETDVCADIMSSNDRDGISESARESSLTYLFNSINIEVEFVD